MGKVVVTEEYDLDAVDNLADVDDPEEECECEGCECECDEVSDEAKKAIYDYFNKCILAEKIAKEEEEKQDDIVNVINWLKAAGFKVVD